MEVQTTQYQFSHGRRPRGRGTWWFRIGDEMVSFSGSYSEARRAAERFARERGARRVEVCP